MPESNTYPIEIKPLDISPYRKGNTNCEYITTFDSGRPGPHVMLSALVHGNELCGAVVLDRLFRESIRPVRGRLTLGFLNVAAYERFDPEQPEASRWVDEDFNRLWSASVLDGNRDSTERRRVRKVRPLIDEVDFLLDLHSMQHASAPLLLAGPLEKGRALARKVAFPALVVCDKGHAAGPRMRDYGGFGEAASPKNALLVECGQHWAQRTVEVAQETAVRFLANFGVIDAGLAARHLSLDPAPQQVVEVTHPVTITSDNFHFTRHFTGLEVIANAGTVIGWDGERAVTTPYDNCVLIMPSKRLYKGQTAVRLGRFVS